MNKMKLALCIIFSLFQPAHAMMQRAFSVEGKKNITSQLQKSKLPKRFYNSSHEHVPGYMRAALSGSIGILAFCITAPALSIPFGINKNALIASELVGVGVAGALGGWRGAMLPATFFALMEAHEYFEKLNRERERSKKCGL